MKKVFNIEIDCASCANKCEQAVKKLNGVEDCLIDFINQRMILESSDVDGVFKDVLKTIRKIEPDFEIIE